MTESTELPQELRRLEGDLEELFLPVPSAEIRQRVLGCIHRELRAEALQRRFWLAGKIAAALALGINLVWSAGLWTGRAPAAPQPTVDLEAVVTRIQKAMPDLSEATAKGYAARLHAASSLILQPDPTRWRLAWPSIERAGAKS